LSEGKGRVPQDAAKTKRQGKADASPAEGTKRTGQRPGDIGRALRSVYDETLREDVPDEFKDLLGKLG
jgi:hypothetical protein